MLGLVGGTVFLTIGVTLISFHRRIARRFRNDALSIRPAESVLSLRAYTIVWLGIGLLYAIVGALSVAGTGHNLVSPRRCFALIRL